MPILLFEEKQRFKPLWIWILILSVMSITLWTLYKPAFSMQSIFILSMTMFIHIAIIVFLLSCQLRTEITESYISYQFYPFHTQKRALTWATIKEAKVRKYSPLAEYGGWGLRWGFNGGVAYNVAGNQGLDIELHDGRSILIGTQKPNELAEVLAKL
ncbi:MAG: hypothetical protein JJT94_12555 [Bernardetiaceae bacterium]|nr:hypothetical protein [Bernardetiaceae bacterium]